MVGATGGCGRGPAGDPELARKQRETLASIFYRGGPLPPSPTEDEEKLIRKRVRDSQPWERDLLEELYPDDPELWVYATRDSDGDGIHDVRVSDYYGKFLEGDTDLDGDGLDNVLDGQPFVALDDAGARREIPAHLDWQRQGKPPEMSRIQQQLFANHRILLVERSAEFTPHLARAVYDVVTRVYAGVFDGNGTLSTLRIVATEESSLLDPEAEEGAGDFAQVLPATQTLEVYRRGIDAKPIIQLGFLAHETAHNIQFAFDYDAQRQDEIRRRNYFAAPHFFELVEPYGWSIVATELDLQAEFMLFRPQYISQEPYEYLYLEEPLEDWEAWLEAIYEEVGDESYLIDERLTELHILGDYSLSGPWEWYSDHVIAYLYLALLDSLEASCETSEWNALRRSLQRETVESEWPYFRFENARGADIQVHLEQQYPLADTDITYLTDTYLLQEYPQFCADSSSSGD